MSTESETQNPLPHTRREGDGVGLREAGSLPPELVRAQLDALCDSASLSSSPRLKLLLNFLVQEALAGNPLKESIIGVAVFGREPGYDPKQDSVVRTEARRLRAKLIEYYAGAGAQDEFVIQLPKGSYVPIFLQRPREAVSALPDENSEPAGKLVAGHGITARPEATASQHAPRRRIAYLLGTIVVVLAGLTIARLVVERVTAPVNVTHVVAAPRLSVAVLAFHDMSSRKRTAWLANAIPEMISADLAADSKVRAIPGEKVTRMETELQLQPATARSAATLSAIRRNLGAEIVISGGFADTGAQGGSQVRVQVVAQDTETGETIASIAESGKGGEILDVISRSEERLRDQLSLGSSIKAEQASRQATPQNLEAARAYSDGLVLVRRGDLLQGRKLLEDCVRMEPPFAPGHAALAEVESRLGYEKDARDEAQRAYDLSSSLSSEEARLSIEAQFRMANDEPARAAQTLAHLFSMHPYDVDYGLKLAEAQRKANQLAEALSTIQALRKLPPPESSDSGIDMMAALVLKDRADYRQSAALAAGAARKAKQAGANLLYAQAISLQSGLDWYLGDEHWRQLSQEALGICKQFGDQACVAAVLRRFGNSDFAALNLESAEQSFAQALIISQQIGSLLEEENVLNGMALVAHAQGDLRRAQDIQERLLGIARQTGNQRVEQISLANLAGVLLAKGQIDSARQALKSAAMIARNIGDQAAIVDDLVSLAEVDRIRGDLPEAARSCEEGLAVSRKAALPYAELPALAAKTRNLLAADDLAGADSAFQEYQRLQKSGVDTSALGDPTLAAELALADGQPGTAVTLASVLNNKTAEKHLSLEQAQVESLLAKALLAENKTAEAQKTIESAWARVRQSQAQLTRTAIGITRARVTRDAALLPGLIAEAKRSHEYELELEARMAEAQIGGKSQELASLRHQAVSRGFKHLARTFS
jgi:TolB-like protein